jgi:FkbM family methyltransferase
MLGKITQKLRSLRRIQKTMGLYQGAKWRIVHSLDRRGLLRGKVRLQPAILPHPFALRMGTSDSSNFAGMLIVDVYGCCKSLGDVKTILDLGANNGASGALFLAWWPNARVVAVEPDPGNYEILQSNLRLYGSVQCVQGAAWSRRTNLALSRENGDGREWATMVLEGIGAVRAYTMDELVSLLGTVDLLKINIEGGEKAIFSGDTSWIARVRNICIEFHGADCESAFREGMKGYCWEESRHGGFIMCRSISPRREAGAVAV